MHGGTRGSKAVIEYPPTTRSKSATRVHDGSLQRPKDPFAPSPFPLQSHKQQQQHQHQHQHQQQQQLTTNTNAKRSTTPSAAVPSYRKPTQSHMQHLHHRREQYPQISPTTQIPFPQPSPPPQISAQTNGMRSLSPSALPQRSAIKIHNPHYLSDAVVDAHTLNPAVSAQSNYAQVGTRQNPSAVASHPLTWQTSSRPRHHELHHDVHHESHHELPNDPSVLVLRHLVEKQQEQISELTNLLRETLIQTRSYAPTYTSSTTAPPRDASTNAQIAIHSNRSQRPHSAKSSHTIDASRADSTQGEYASDDENPGPFVPPIPIKKTSFRHDPAHSEASTDGDVLDITALRRTGFEYIQESGEQNPPSPKSIRASTRSPSSGVSNPTIRPRKSDSSIKAMSTRTTNPKNSTLEQKDKENEPRIDPRVLFVKAGIEILTPEVIKDTHWEGRKFEWTTEVEECRNDLFEVDTFKPMQRAIINAIMSGKSCFLRLRPSFGKTFCYQICGCVLPGVMVIIVPSLEFALLESSSLEESGVGVQILSQQDTDEDIDTLLEDVISEESETKFIFATADLFLKNKFILFIRTLQAASRISRFVVEEAHSLSSISDYYTPSYERLSAKQDVMRTPIILVSSYSPDYLVADILQKLSGRKYVYFRESYFKPNLKVSCIPRDLDRPAEQISQYLIQSYEGMSGIIYCSNTQECNEIFEAIQVEGFSGAILSDDMEFDEISQIVAQWVEGEILVIVATREHYVYLKKTDVRFVVHCYTPPSMHTYHREIGTIGLDEKPASSIVFYHSLDMCFDERTMNDEMLDYCKATGCRWIHVSTKLGEEYLKPKGCDALCDNCDERRKANQTSKEELFRKYVFDGLQREFVQKRKTPILSDVTIISISTNPPRDINTLAGLPTIGKDVAHRYGAQILALIEHAYRRSQR
eukprot:TRINITY_DN4505_c0_g2_i1.p1 TRINITY_DN4505_c0_g2~~TRINITY_DN4505_c0_g2_i1.p1  ORF type:complete len:926 (+),score=174.92 TRINITY_DN4505_c0_g2_i1:43-2820(+)